MPNRIIKESICTSDNLDALSWFEEVLFYRLIVNCDDFGRMDARPPILRARLFPLKTVTDKQIISALQSLRSAGIIDIYDVDGRSFLQMRTWERHQQLRAKKSKYPSPDGNLTAPDSTCNQMISNDINCNQMQSNVPVIQYESEYQYQYNTREKSAPAHTRGELKAYGKFQNVMLTEEEYQDLLVTVTDATGRIEAFGAKIAAKGYTYDNHYAAILLWYQEDKKKGTQAGSFDIDDFFAAALKRTYG